MSDVPTSDDLADAPGPITPDDLAGSLDAVTRERDELRDRWLRKTAEFDNFRKRVDRERHEFTEWAAADVITEILAVVDDFERALAVDAPPEAEAYRSGIELIHRQLIDLLKKRGVTPVATVGQPFDPHLHQAVAYDESPGTADGQVIGELRRGYRLGERLLRPALVRVAKAS
jgi:molecular chaperone GrpE